ncbi:MAG: Gx transporter family protein [Clostridia bacterium]|nr:Gx transporter family protein [Clostridia bacterium]
MTDGIRSGQAYRTTLSAMMTSLALIFSYVEMLMPLNLGIPGIKLGLANLVVLMAIYRLGGGYGFAIDLARIFLSALLFGNVSAMLYSLAGGILSFAVMYLLYRTKLFSPIGVSLAGGVTHNIGQLTVAALVTETGKIFIYLPVLMTAGFVTGAILGVLAALIMKRMKWITAGSGDGTR